MVGISNSPERQSLDSAELRLPLLSSRVADRTLSMGEAKAHLLGDACFHCSLLYNIL